MKRYVIFLLFTFSSLSFAQTIDLKVLNEYHPREYNDTGERTNISAALVVNNKAYFELSEIDFLTGKYVDVKPDYDAMWAITSYENNIVIYAIDPSRNRHENKNAYNAFFIYNPTTGEIQHFKEKNNLIEIGIRMHYFQNGVFYYTAAHPLDDMDDTTLKPFQHEFGKYYFETDSTEPLADFKLEYGWDGSNLNFSAFSPDKNLMLFGNRFKVQDDPLYPKYEPYDVYAIYDREDLSSPIIKTDIQSLGQYAHGRFVNSRVYYGIRGTQDYWSLSAPISRPVMSSKLKAYQITFGTIDDGLTIEWDFTVKGIPVAQMVVSDDAKRALVIPEGFREYEAGEIPVYLVDLSPVYNKLKEEGYIWEPRMGTINSDNVRVRQNGNLEAKIMETLQTGDEITVLDEGSIKRLIDPWGKQYWYKIQRESDGLTGWVFGAFLDVEGKGLLDRR